MSAPLASFRLAFEKLLAEPKERKTPPCLPPKSRKATSALRLAAYLRELSNDEFVKLLDAWPFVGRHGYFDPLRYLQRGIIAKLVTNLNKRRPRVCTPSLRKRSIAALCSVSSRHFKIEWGARAFRYGGWASHLLLLLVAW
jgi:hypothetical protein